MKKFDLGVSSIEFDAPAENYRALRVKFRKASLAARRKFEKRYPYIFSNPLEFSASLERVSAEYLNKAVNSAIDDLINHDVVDVDERVLIEHYSQFNLSWMNDIAPVREAYNEIVRGALKEQSEGGSGPSMVGGGFGVEGAAAGIAVATAANAALGVATGLVRAVGSSLNSLSTKQNLAQLIASQSSQTILHLAIESLVFNLHKSIVQIIIAKRSDWPVSLVDKECEVSARCMINNVIAGRFSDDKANKVLAAAICLNPYDEGAYWEWRKREFPHQEDLLELAEYVGVSLSDGKGTADLPSLVSLPKSDDLEKGFRDILAAFKSADFFAYGNIPEGKRNNAISKYFYPDFFLERPYSGLGVDTDLGPLMGLVDATVFGSAENGLAIGLTGFCWIDQSDSGAYTWEEFVRRELIAKPGLMSIKIGDRSFGNNSQVKNALLAALINDLAALYRSISLRSG